MHTKKILFAAALLTVLAACSSDDQSSEPMEQLTPVTLHYTTIDATETRAAQDLNQGTFVSGEEVAVLISNTGEDSWSYYNFTTLAAGEMTPMNGTPPYYPAGSQNIDIAAYYPGSHSGLYHNQFYVATDQTSDDAYKFSDLMFASVTNQAKQAEAVNLAFSHKMAKLCVNITAGTGVGSINSVSILNVKSGIEFDVENGTFGELLDDPKTIAMSNEGAACIPPQTIDGGLLSITTDKGTATYTVSNKAFESGKVYTINLTVNLRAIGTTNAITGWTSEGTVTVVAERPLPHIAEHEYVDMGTVTIGGVEKNLKWATCNMGACYPWEYGDYYAWGATTPFYQYGYSEESPGTHWIDGKTGYNWASCPFYSTKNPTKYNSTDGKLSFADDDYADDAARQRWGATWRIPTHEEWTALCDASLYDWVPTTNYQGSGKDGMLVTRKAGTGPCSGNSIFLPAAGNWEGSEFKWAGTWGSYWSSSVYTDNYFRARNVLFDDCDVWKNSHEVRYYGLSIRPVSD